MAVKQRKRIYVLVGGAACFLFLSVGQTAYGGTRYTTWKLKGSWNGLQGVTFKAGDDECTVNFGTGTSAECAQEAIDTCNGVNNFTVSRVGSKLKICHPTRKPKLVDEDGFKNLRTNACDFFNPLAGFATERLIETRGTAVGGGTVNITVEDLVADVPTFAGQSAEEIANALVEALDLITPDDDPAYGFGTAFVGSGGVPTDSVDIGIEELGNRDLANLVFSSTDSGITLFEEPLCSVPTVSEWGLIVMALLALTAGTIVFGRRRRPAVA